ncbi:52 kDa repressor of the inhibitor of the protein kinase-like [Aphis craccivora]|uniref:52 kDa repressor of the inhibitor of the protein kinase-like n=1 Tax=Aphis craccivora TaxID=307492 RepID=A0A6G0YGE5_APHCR|nr:52 kDa repressor of the inhibitor of the protein kinase-like [Aphis craccivora]
MSPALLYDENEDVEIKILGLKWDPRADVFSFNTKSSQIEPTKRSVISDIVRVFDLLGLLSPITFWTKHVMQLLWTAGLKWDDPIPKDIIPLWKRYQSELKLLWCIKGKICLSSNQKQAGCRVLLNRTDLKKLQYLEWSIHETVARKSTIIRPVVLKLFEIIGNFIDREFSNVLSPPKTIEEMIIFIKNLKADHIIKNVDLNFVSQLKMFAAPKLAEQRLRRSREMSPELFVDPISPFSSNNLTSLEVGYGELKLWYNSCAFKSPNLSSTITELFFNCNPDFFPVISKLLQILITLPVTTATGERIFSSLHRLKNYLRNTTGQIRLNGLAVFNIQQDINVDPSMIIDEMDKTSKRRLNINL